MRLRPRDQRGGALVESPIAVVVLVAIGLGAFWIGNIVLRYHQLEEAVHAGARYAARAYYDPAGGASRRRTAAEITAYTANAAAPLTPTIQIRCGSDLNSLASAPICTSPHTQPAGTYIQVTASSVVAEDDPVMAIARSVNGLFGALHAGSPFPDTVTVTDTSVAIVE